MDVFLDHFQVWFKNRRAKFRKQKREALDSKKRDTDSPSQETTLSSLTRSEPMNEQLDTNSPVTPYTDHELTKDCISSLSSDDILCLAGSTRQSNQLLHHDAT